MKRFMIGAAIAGAIALAATSAVMAPAAVATAHGLVAVPGARVAPFRSDRIVVQVVGSGPDVVLIPGLNSSPRAWGGLTAAVPGYRYHLVQLNGFAGLPAAGAASGDVAAPAAEEIARYIDAAGLKRPALIGHSMGGTMAMMVAARHPDRVGRLMVVDMLPFMGVMFGGPAATPASLKLLADQMTAEMRAAPPMLRKVQMTGAIDSMIKTASLRAGPLSDSLASDPAVSTNAFHELIVTDLRPELANISVPTTVLFIRPAAAFYPTSYSMLRGAKLKRIDDSAHFIMLDQPQRFAAEVKAFLAGSR